MTLKDVSFLKKYTRVIPRLHKRFKQPNTTGFYMQRTIEATCTRRFEILAIHQYSPVICHSLLAKGKIVCFVSYTFNITVTQLQLTVRPIDDEQSSSWHPTNIQVLFMIKNYTELRQMNRRSFRYARIFNGNTIRNL